MSRLKQLTASQLFNLATHDPISFAAVTLGTLAVSVAATLIPVRRAASVEPS